MLYDSKTKVRTVRLYPSAPAGSPYAAMFIAVAFMAREAFKLLAYAYDAVMAENRRARRAMMARFPKDVTCPACAGEGLITVPVEQATDPSRVACKICELSGKVSDYPECHEPRWIAPELLPAVLRLQRELVAATVRAVEGVEVEANGEPPMSPVELLEHTEHLEVAFVQALRHQSPEKEEVFSSGS